MIFLLILMFICGMLFGSYLERKHQRRKEVIERTLRMYKRMYGDE